MTSGEGPTNYTAQANQSVLPGRMKVGFLQTYNQTVLLDIAGKFGVLG